MKIAVVTTDARMSVIYRSLSATFDTVELHKQKDFIKPDDLDVLILPVKGITEEGNLDHNGKYLEIPQAFWKGLKKEVKIFCGLPNPFLDAMPNEIIYYMKEESVLAKNAILTAEGVLFLLIDNTKQSIQKLCVDIIGYGRCGKEIHKWLKALHVNCRIIRRKVDGLSQTMCIEEWKRTKPYDVIINTSIQPIINKECVDAWKNKPLIIDIATPDVIDGEYARKKGIRFVKAGNLPALIAFESAGELIAEYVRGILQHGK